MNVSQIEKSMVDYCKGSLHDVNHMVKVHSYARLIGECEGLSASEQLTLEVAAIVHDIACPLCRIKYGNTDKDNQEREGEVLAREFLADKELAAEVIERVAYLVAHHHTYTGAIGRDYQILLEADYLVNADEHGDKPEKIGNMMDKVFKTVTGTALLKSMYLRALL